MAEKPDPYGRTEADYERAQAAIAAALGSPTGLRNSPYLDRPLRTPDQVLAERAKREAKLSPGMAAALVRVAERGENSCDIDERERGLTAAIALAKFDDGQATEKGTGMDINQIYKSKHLKAEELQGREANLTIGNVEVENFEEGPKIVLGFHGTERTLVLNRTNARLIGEMYGTETNVWLDKPLTIYPDKVDFKGKIVDTIRIRYVGQQQFTAPQQPAAPAPATNGPLPDPGATPPAAAVQPASQMFSETAAPQPDQSGRPIGGMGAAIDDKIPF